MTKKYFLYSVLMFIALPLSSIFAQDADEQDVAEFENGSLITCGVERWAVKTCYDADTSKIDFSKVVESSVAYQRSLTKPTLPGDNTTRLASEDTVYVLNVQMMKIKLEDDQDIHVEVCTIGNTSETMVAEVVNPECPNIINTSRYATFKTLRDWFVATYSPTTSFKTINVNARITGVGFFDFLHGQTGIPPNGREIHPILSISLTLPVELSSFTYKTVGNGVKLEWETKTEINNNHFEIERRDVSPYWTKIGEVKGAGNSNSPKQYFFLDNQLPTNGKYYYHLKQIDNDGQLKYSDEIAVDVKFVPAIYTLGNNFPNPFNPSTVIRYSIPVESNVKLSVYNSLGQVVVKELTTGIKPAGTYDINFNAYSLKSGIYYYTLHANSTDGKHNFTATKKMVYLK